MTTTAPATPATRTGVTPGPPHLVRAELLKIRTTNIWWILGICAFVGLALTFFVNALQAYVTIDNAQRAIANPPIGENGQFPTDGLDTVLVRAAGNIYTTGQFLGALVIMLFGILVVTNEFAHQTATATFLASPRRVPVVAAKMAAVIAVAAGYWLVSTAIDVAAGSFYFHQLGHPTNLDAWPVQRAILVNLLAYALWAVLGVALGVLIRGQVAATLTGAGVYVLGTFVVQIVFTLVRQYLVHGNWILQAQVVLPGVASQVMVTSAPLHLGFFDGAIVYGPPWWVGALILLGWGVLASALGTALIRRRDIS